MGEVASAEKHERRKLKELNTDMKQTEEPGWFQDVSSIEDDVKHGDLDFQLQILYRGGWNVRQWFIHQCVSPHHRCRTSTGVLASP